MILGIDEVGRGAWAGPVVVGAVVLGREIKGLTDSKLLSKKRREVLYENILEQAAGVGLGWVTAEEIDEIGLAVALKLATKKAVKSIKTPYHQIILDGTSNFLADTPLGSHVTLMKKADLLIPSVSAASVVAKVERDRYMARQDDLFPGYGFAGHVGYGTAKHRAAIHKNGVSPLHRLSIAPLSIYKSSRSPRNHPDSEDDPPTTRQIGNQSESLAASSLEADGFKIIERNWRTKVCEIDIIATKHDCYYFVEVKHRKNDQAGDGLAAVTAKKLNRMKFAADIYSHRYSLTNVNQRLMVISTSGQPPHVDDVLELS